MQTDTKSMSPGEALAGRMAAAEPSTKPATAMAPIERSQPTSKDDAYAKLAARFARMIESADREATAVVDEAKADASRILDQARTEADRVRVDAQARAEEARQQGSEELIKAKREADRILGSLANRRESLVTQMQEMQTRLLSVAKDLEVAMDERDAATTAATNGPAAATGPSGEPSAGASPSTPTRRSSGDDLVDPRYEDLWASGKDTVDIPDLAPMDLDFDDDKPGSD
jgi:cell division initiation protein